jgi:predicted transcriptional regulator YheO
MSAAVPEHVREQIFASAIRIAEGISRTLGDGCEVVVNDHSRPDAAIVWIRGNLTGRRVGDPITSFGLRRILGLETKQDVYNLLVRTERGQILKKSTIFLRTPDDQVIGSLCINIDITGLLALHDGLRSLCHVEPEASTAAQGAAPTHAVATVIAQAERHLRQSVEARHTARPVTAG